MLALYFECTQFLIQGKAFRFVSATLLPIEGASRLLVLMCHSSKFNLLKGLQWLSNALGSNFHPHSPNCNHSYQMNLTSHYVYCIISSLSCSCCTHSHLGTISLAFPAWNASCISQEEPSQMVVHR